MIRMLRVVEYLYFKGVMTLILGSVIVCLSCSSQPEEVVKIKGVDVPPPSAPSQQRAADEPAASKVDLSSATVVASVDGVVLTKATLEKDFQERLKEIANKLPKDKLKEVSLNLKRTLIDEFIVRTLLQNEVRKRKITVSDQEIKAAVTRMEDNLPQGVTFAEMMRKSGLSREKLNEEVALGIQVNKLIAQQAKGKADPTDKEIQDFYRNNKEKFKMPESVHVRHILIGIAKGDDASIRDQKRRKAEDLRQQLLAGADFAALAKENSDCPSKSQGGDLGTFTRGQMVKAFEDAAFSQKKNVVGPPVETEYGYHLIEVLERHPPRLQPLDGPTKERIRTFLMQKKRYEAFQELMASLKQKADIKIVANLE